MKKCNKLQRLIILCTILVFMFMLAACKYNNQKDPVTNKDSITKSAFMLNTIVTVTIYDKQDDVILDSALEICKQYETIFSRTSETSELYKLNHGQLPKDGDAYLVSDDLAQLLRIALDYSKRSNGAFDLTIAPVSSLWDFTAENPKVPSKKEIEKALSKVGYENLVVEDNKVTFLKDGMGIDLGAIAKGYIADKIKNYLESAGVTSAMINLGGNVLCVGEKIDNSAFNIGIQKPFADRNETVAIMQLKDKSVVSSGVYERYFIQDEKQYHHILNPKTGYPYENDLVAVTIISDESVDGDALSTTCFALGLENGLEFINNLDGVYAAFITSDYEIHYSDGFNEAIPITE